MKRDFGIHFPRCFFFWAKFKVSLFRFHTSEFPLKLLDHQWNSPPPGGKMEAFKSAAREMIRDLARSIRLDDNTQFRVEDIFDSFDPATTNPRGLVTVLDLVRGAHTCPADNHPYTLTVETKP